MMTLLASISLLPIVKYNDDSSFAIVLVVRI